MNLEQLLSLIGAKEVDLFLTRKRVAELEAELAALKAPIAPTQPSVVD